MTIGVLPLGADGLMQEGVNAKATQHAFSTDLSHIYGETPELKVWAYGHTHFNNRIDRIDASTRLLSNQRGYPSDICSGCKPDLVFTLQDAVEGSCY